MYPRQKKEINKQIKTKDKSYRLRNNRTGFRNQRPIKINNLKSKRSGENAVEEGLF